MRTLMNAAAFLLPTALLLSSCGGDDDGGSGPGGGDVLTSVVVTPSTASLASVAPGNTVQLAAVAKDQDGGTMSGVTPTYTSQDPGVATVSGGGLVTAVGAGTTQILASATVGGVTKQGSATVTVEAPPALVLTSVTVSPGTASIFTLAPANTISLSATGRDQNGSALDGVTFSYSSGDEAVATVSPAGVVTAVGAGTAQITASGTRDGVTKEGSSSVTVQVAAATATVLAPLNFFDPTVVDVSAGGTVTWTFAAVTHNVDFASASAPADIGAFSQGSESRAFPASGTYEYVCTLHQGMVGTVRVH